MVAAPPFGDDARSLDGVLVVEVGELASAPACTLVLQSLGARVIKVEPPRAGDRARATGPFRGFPGQDNSVVFAALNRGKRSVTLDVSMPSSMPLMGALLARADVLVENVAHRVSAGPLDTAWCLAQNPDLVLCHLSPLGLAAGARSGLQTELQAMAASGVSTTIGVAGGGPRPLPAFASGVNAGLYAAVGVLAELAGGPGSRSRVLDVSEAEALLGVHTVSDLIDWVLDQRLPERTGARQTRDGFSSETAACADGFAHVSLVIDQQRQNLRRAMAADGFEADDLQDAEGGISTPVREWLGTKTKSSLLSLELSQDIGVVPALTGAEFSDWIAAADASAPLMGLSTHGRVPTLGEHNHELWPDLFERVYGDARLSTAAYEQGLI